VKWLRYPVLVVFVIAGVVGIGSLFQLLAPYSSYGRIATMIFQPLWKGCNNLLAMAAEHYESYAFYSVDTWMRSLPVLIIAAVTLVVLFILAWRGGRTYCNTICPVGTILSFFARFSWLKVRFDADKCKNCSLCSKNCKAACIDYKTHTVDYSRCVVCGNCIDKCKFGALKYSGSVDRGVKSESTQDKGRRSFLLASALVSTAAFAQKKEKLMDGGLAEIEDKVQPERQTPLTPPGSLSFQNLSTRCTGCQLCVSECPNQVLRPSNDLLHLMQPTMSYEKGYCRPECTRCSDVCPAGAIKPLDDIEKSSIQIGHAVWIKKNCVVLTDEVECGNCARHCPSGAIEMVPLDENNEESPMIPAINEAVCIGCGACEYVCPSRPFSAIFVEGHEVHKII
jgi:ferredoxin